MADFSRLKAIALEIKEAVEIGENTAEKVGGLLSDMVDAMDSMEEGAEAGGTAYQKPQGGIPKSDLEEAAQSSLSKADTAIQQHQDISGLAEAVNVADYTTEDAEMPKGALYHYNGLPVHSRNILVDDGDIGGEEGNTTDCVIICLHNDQSAETHGSMYYAFANIGAKLKYVHQWEYNDAPEYVKEVFGESETVSTESAMDALPTTIDGRGVRSIKKGVRLSIL